MMAAAVAVGCHNDNFVEDVPTTPESYCDKLTLNVGEETTRVFNSKLEWIWEESDTIIGYQDDGGKQRNKLTLVSENQFFCENFKFYNLEADNFHFFYANEETEGTLTAVQDGTWRPVLVGTVKNTQLKNISEVSMEHLSAALEFTLYEEDKETKRNIVSARLTGNGDFVGRWIVKDDLTYTHSISGNEIYIELATPSPTVVFNMPTRVFEDNYLTLTLTTASGATITKKLPEQTFEAGQRNKFNIAMPKPAYLPEGNTFRTAIKNNLGSCTAIKFVTNSATTSATTMAPASGDQPIYLVTNGSTLEIHTPAPEFIANENCVDMFSYLDSITAIDFDGFNTSKVTSMTRMFQNCEALTSLDLSYFDTSNVTTMIQMFENCQKLTTLDLSKFDTSKVTSMAQMFYDCQKLTTLDLSKFNTSKVTSMAKMFENCFNLAEPNLILNFSFSSSPSVSNMLQYLGGFKDAYNLYVTQEAYNYLNGKDLGTHNQAILTVK